MIQKPSEDYLAKKISSLIAMLVKNQIHNENRQDRDVYKRQNKVFCFFTEYISYFFIIHDLAGNV